MVSLLIASTAVAEAAGEHEVEATALGLNAGGWVALAMLVVFAVMLWKKVPQMIGQALDAKIAAIRDQLAEAESLRKEAEALKAEYQAKAADADSDAAATIERARHEADEIIAKAKADAEALVARRGRMAEEKIAAEERSAVEELRAAAAEAAALAAARIIEQRHDAASDARLIDQAIGQIGAR
jgi:F-type H+-transporting ATPase subunit b